MSDATSRRPVPDYQGCTWAIGLSVFAASLTMVLGVLPFFERWVAATGLFILTGNVVARRVGGSASACRPGQPRVDPVLSSGR
jgi:hypothetical protein